MCTSIIEVVRAEGVRAVVAPTIMKGPDESAALARVVLSA